MKNLLPAIFLSLIGSVALLPAQEAWILEMPHKYSDYLIKKAIEEGSISELRYSNYLKLVEEVQDQNYWERKTDW